MAGTLNKVMLIGHLGDEVKMHYFDDRNSIGRFPIATNESYTNKQTGEKVTISPKKLPFFKSGKELKERVDY